MNHTVLPANYTMPAFPLQAFTRWCHPLTGEWQTSDCSLLLIYWPQRDKRLSWPGWLTYSRRFIHIKGNLTATDREQDRESSPVKDRRSTAVPRNQPKKKVQCNGLASVCLSVCLSCLFPNLKHRTHRTLLTSGSMRRIPTCIQAQQQGGPTYLFKTIL